MYLLECTKCVLFLILVIGNVDMKLKPIVLLLLIFFSTLYNAAIGQRQHYMDSVTQVLKTVDDIEKINIYNSLSWSYKFSSPQLAYEYGEKSFDLSKKLNITNSQATALNRMGAARLRQGELSQSLELLLKAVEICHTYKYPTILATSLRQIGDVHQAQGNTSEAMKYYFNSLSLGDSLDIPIIKARSAKKVAMLYITLNRTEIAKKYLDYALGVFEKEEFLRGVHQVYILYGDFYYVQNLPDSAIINYTIALDFLDKLKDRHGYATAKARIARVYESIGEYARSLEGYTNALDTFELLGDKKQIVSMYLALANTYINTKEKTKALQYAKKALGEAKELGLPQEEKEADYLLFTIFKKIGNLGLAVNYLEKYLFLMDSLTNSTESWRIDQLRKSYDLEIQLKENELNTAIISNQMLTIKNERLLKKYLVAIVVAFIILVIIIWYSLRHARKANKQLVLANEEKNEAISLISHDLKSPFNKIKGLTHLLELQLENTPDSDKDLLSKINLVTHDGLRLVQNLVDIKAIKVGAFNIKLSPFNLNDFIIKRIQSFEQVANAKNIKLSFQPLKGVSEVSSDSNTISRIFDNILSNAIKFSPKGEIVTVDCSILKNNFSFSISDNGKGIAQEEIIQIFNQYKTGFASPTGNEISSGLGLSIASSLVNKLEGTIKCISKINNGATFIISLPIIKIEATE
jgi:signal transduction histidine kinase